ncbi:MAG: hypothetical protein D6808_00305 [Candidatus Dadabacteria bacterium]|nr:MAG: hypothetical protein D6808_00305 [Candidatus Dadabacteria bacterium]
MFGVSFSELIFVLVIALIVFGPEKLPEIAVKLGRFAASLRRAGDSVRREIYNSVYAPAKEVRMSLEERTRDLISVPTSPQTHADSGTPDNVEDKDGRPSSK